MNDIFSIKRFGMVLKNDLVKYMPNIYGMFAIAVAVIPVIWIISTLFEHNISPTTRETAIAITCIILTFLSPFILYLYVNDRKRGIDYLMLPASSLEKYLSIILNCCVIIPFSFYAVAVCTDIILTAIPFGAFENFLPFHRIFSLRYLDKYLELILLMSAPIYGTLLFRKHKRSKTVLSIIILIIVGNLILSYASYWAMRDYSEKYLKEPIEEVIKDIRDAKVTEAGDSIEINCGNKRILLPNNKCDNQEANINIYVGENKNTVLSNEILDIFKNHYKTLKNILVALYYLIPALFFVLSYIRLRRLQA